MLLVASFRTPALRSSAYGILRQCAGSGKSASTYSSIGNRAYYSLPNGDKIPAVALGTWKAPKGEVGAAVKSALEEGYRHLDCAWAYGNEDEVGNAIIESKVPREDIWITSKLFNYFHQPEDVEPVLDETLKNLKVDSLDLYLMHWPVAFKKGTDKEVDFDLTENPYITWKKMEEMVDKGKVRNIGVSNFNVRRLKNLTANPLKYQPVINQVELNYFNPQPELVQWSKDNGVLLEAYSPLGSSDYVKKGLDVKEIKEVAAETGLTPAQVTLSWLWQRGVVVLPKSVRTERIRENFQIRKLPEDAFNKVEKAASSHPQFRTVNPDWGIDVFEDDK